MNREREGTQPKKTQNKLVCAFSFFFQLKVVKQEYFDGLYARLTQTNERKRVSFL